MAICRKGYDINKNIFCGNDCTKCIHYCNLNKAQRIIFRRMVNYYFDIRFVYKDKPVECKYCKFYRPEDYDEDGNTLAMCTLGKLKECPYISNNNRDNVIKNIQNKIVKCEKQLEKDNAFIKTKWLADKDYFENWCLGCKHDNETDIEICNKCSYRDKFEEIEEI